jgi:PAS domain S-box-containing protein
MSGIKWPDLKHLDGYLPADLEKGYRQHYLKDDVRVASITILLLCIPLVAFIYNDFLLFGLVPAFYFLVALRTAYLIYVILLIVYLRKNQSYNRMDWNLFIWLALSMILMIAINLTRPSSYAGNFILDVVIIILAYLGVPTRLRFRFSIAYVYTVAELFIFFAFRETASPLAAFSTIVSLVLANIIGIYISHRLYSFRRNEYQAGTEREQTLETLQQNEERRRHLFENMQEGLSYCKMLFDDQGHPVDWVYLNVNSTFERLTGLKNITGQKVTVAIPNIKELNPELFDVYGRVALTGQPEKFEIDFKPLNMWLAVSVYSPAKEYFVAVFADVTGHKKAEEELLLRAQILDNATDIIFLRRFDGSLIYTNEAALKAWGYSREEIYKLHISQLVKEGDPGIIDRRRQEVMEKGVAIFETSFTRKDGSATPVEVKLSLLEIAGKRYMLGIARDITERKKMLDNLVVSDRLSSLGQMAMGFSHELNNPLSVVIGYSQLLLGKKNLAADVRPELEHIHSQAQRAADIIKNFLYFSQMPSSAKQPVELNNIIANVLKLREYENKNKIIAVITLYDADLPAIMADASKIQQVFLDIIMNAEYFMLKAHNKGTLTITTEKTGDMVKVSFADDGPGIPRENLSAIFNPFFTTKEVGHGTGLGLSISHSIISEHGGRIYAESEPGQGATLIIELPAAA